MADPVDQPEKALSVPRTGTQTSDGSQAASESTAGGVGHADIEREQTAGGGPGITSAPSKTPPDHDSDPPARSGASGFDDSSDRLTKDATADLHEPTVEIATVTTESPLPEAGTSRDPERTAWASEHWVMPKKARVRAIETGYYAGRDAVGEEGRLGTTQPTVVPRSRRGSQHRPDTVIDAFEIGHIRVAAASVRGMSHHAHRQNRQDAYSVGPTQDEKWLVIVIADGVSSGKLSEIAADVAAESGVKETLAHLDSGVALADIPWSEISRNMARAVRDRARTVAARSFKTEDGQPLDPAELSDRDLCKVMATTAEILAVAAEPGESGSHQFARVVVAGDGSGFVLDPDLGWRALSIGKEPDDTPVSHAVRPLPMENLSAPSVQTGEIEPGQALVCVTDGYGQQMVDGSTAFASYLFSRLREPLDSPQYLHAVSYINNSANDDRTIVTVWARPDAPSADG